MSFLFSFRYALTESNLMNRLDPKDLSIIECINVAEHTPTATTTIAHAHFENDGSWITMGFKAIYFKIKPMYMEFRPDKPSNKIAYSLECFIKVFNFSFSLCMKIILFVLFKV